MTDPDETTLARRNLIRGGAVLAGAAGLTAAGAALAPKASAANGAPVLLGNANAATATTSITNTPPTGTTNSATLFLANATNQPTLALRAQAAYAATDPLPNLQPGQFLCTTEGPYVGVSDGQTNAAAFLVTGYDIDVLPTPVPLSPARLLDTRSAATRVILRSSRGTPGNPFDSAGRLLAGAWIDVPVEGISVDEVLDAGFFNLTTVGSLSAGFLTAYPPASTVPGVSTVNFPKGMTLSNGAFVGVRVYASTYIVRIYTNATTHVILDYTGKSVKGPTAELPASASAAARRQRRGPVSRRLVRVAKRH